MSERKWVLGVVLFAACAGACSSEFRRGDEIGGGNGVSGGGGGGNTPADGGAAGDAGAPSRCEVPTEGSTLLAWLRDGRYRSTSFATESQVHASAGPHGGNVRTYVTRSVVQGLTATPPLAELAECSATVKELYGSGRTAVTGWAVAVKTAPTSAAGASWYWYELLRDETGAKPVADGKNVPLCVGCHSGGKDYVLTPLPLQ